MIEEWVNVKDNPLVIDAEVDDELEFLETGVRAYDSEDDDDSDSEADRESTDAMDIDEEGVATTSIQESKPSLTIFEAEEILRQVREYATEIDAPKEVGHQLLRVGKSLRETLNSRAQSQTSMLSFYLKKSSK